MKSASVPRPLADIIIRAMLDEPGIHHEGWTQRVAPGWYIVRQSSRYKLLHGRLSLGNIEAVRLGPRYLAVYMVSGLDLHFPIREPKKKEGEE